MSDAMRLGLDEDAVNDIDFDTPDFTYLREEIVRLSVFS